MFAGTHTAIVTPFRNGQIDEEALQKLVDFQFTNGVTGVVPCGTTGESPTLDYDEHERVVKLTAEFAKGRGIVMAGTGSNSTREAVEMTQEAEAVGATAILQVAPYYNKPTPEGLYQHFKAVAQSTKLPIMLYSIPGRCGIEIGVDVLERLAETCPNICAIKEAGGNPERVNQMKQVLPASFEILSGDDSLTLPFMAVGGVGVVSVASNEARARWRLHRSREAASSVLPAARRLPEALHEPHPDQSGDGARRSLHHRDPPTDGRTGRSQGCRTQGHHGEAGAALIWQRYGLH
jgi:4-hydroxy-tetrahydrodipicolinate synthase